MAVTLKELGAERDRLLAAVTQVLEADNRIMAAWLSGSFGRGEADEWSDLDLHVAVADEQLQAVLDEHQTLFALCAPPLLVWGGIPSNSMPGGKFWLVQYMPLMLEVDWNIGPASATVRPEKSLLLFDRAGIPTTAPLSPVEDERRRSVASWQLSFFWAMAPLAVKLAGRGHTRMAVVHIDYLKNAFVALCRTLWHPELLQADEYHQNRQLEAEVDARLPRFGPAIDPVQALAVVRGFCQEVEQLHPALAQLGATIHEDVPKQVYALAETAETLARTGGSSPLSGSRR